MATSELESKFTEMSISEDATTASYTDDEDDDDVGKIEETAENGMCKWLRLKTTFHNIPRHNNEEADRGEVLAIISFLKNFSNNLISVVDSEKLVEGKWISNTNLAHMILQTKESEEISTLEEMASWLENIWRNVILENGNNHLWLEIDYPLPPHAILDASKHKVVACKLSFGTFLSPSTFVQHWKSEKCDITKSRHISTESFYGDSDDEEYEYDEQILDSKLTAAFEHGLDMVKVKWVESKSSVWLMEFGYDYMDKFLLSSENRSVLQIFLFLKCRPKLFKGTPKRSRINLYDFVDSDVAPEPEFDLEREVCFLDCARETFGSSNVLLLELPIYEPNGKNLLSRFRRIGYDVFSAHPNVVQFDPAKTVKIPRFPTFNLDYACFCLTSRGFCITDQITTDFLSFFMSDIVPNSQHLEIINAVTNYFDTSSICNLKESFLAELEKVREQEILSKDDPEKFPNLTKMRRLILTPTTLKGLPEELTVENRVIRQFSADWFVRVTIRDEDFHMLTTSTARLHGPVREVIKFLTDGIRIGERHYKFLGCSNSQLREHGLWMYATDGKDTVETIRQWMGDLSHERCVGAYVARLGQCFTSTKKTVEVENCERIEDVKMNNYVFTDGIGKISQSLAEKVSEELKLSVVPSAFQIRYGGCKGVVAVDPNIGTEDKMQVRESMTKFESEHKQLEVTSTSSPGSLNLNRQVIMLMSGLKVPKKSFTSLQEAMLSKLADMLINEEDAAEALSQVNLNFHQDALRRSGISLPLEPFLHSVLQTIYKQRLEDLLRRTRIAIPVDKGRIMMGTVDETESLDYGEVYVQYSKDLKYPQKNKQVLTGQVVIAKNPCFHPGDLRKYQAVNKPKLAHMVDCVVFPARGERPHPNEMSGSDLDGDMYFVCWMETLIPESDNQLPMDYTPLPKEKLHRPVTEADMIKFIAEYIESDQLGVIANAHLVHADADKEGIFSDKCKELAKLHSDAVDAPKTGKRPMMRAELRPASYPHYMMKRDKPLYTSKHVIGELFNQCQAIEQCNPSKKIVEIKLDEELLMPGYDKYISEAKNILDIYNRRIESLMTMYGIESEAEILSGHILKLKEQRGFHKGDHIEVRELVKIQITSIRKQIKNMFYEEFENKEEDKEGILKKASALYVACYENIPSGSNQKLGLPWIFWDHLIEIKKLKLACNGRSPWRSFLHKLSEDIIEAANDIQKQLKQNRKTRQDVFADLCRTINELNPNAKLIQFGSTVTMLDSESSTLDIYVDQSANDESSRENFRELVTVLAKSVGDGVPSSGKAIARIFDEKSSCWICLFSQEECLKRTAYILAIFASNKWIIPIVNIIIQWGRNFSLTDDVKDRLLSSENLTLIVIHVVQEMYAEYLVPVTESQIQNVMTLLGENHFEKCSILECSHLQASSEDTIVHGCKEVQESDSLMGDILLKFFRHFSSIREEAVENLRKICDPCETTSTKLLNLGERRYYQLTERMIQAFHSLANSGNIRDFLSTENLESGHFTELLPRQFASSIIFSADYMAKKLKELTGADWVTIRRKPFRYAVAGLVLEAWGSTAALLKLKEKIRDYVESSSTFTRGNFPLSAVFIEEAYKPCFEGYDGPASQLVFEQYRGPCQPGHDRSSNKKVPRLLRPNFTDNLDRERFVSIFKEQMDLIYRKHDPNHHGEMRGVISFGRYYLNNCFENSMVITGFASYISRMASENQSAHVNTNRMRGRGRRGRRNYSNTSSARDERTYPGFIPACDEKLKKLFRFLEQNEFIETETRCEYRPSIKMMIDNFQANVDGVLVLDENFALKHLYMPDIKWLVIDLIRGQSVYDMRFKLHSRPMRTHSELATHPDCKDIFEKHAKLLLRDRDGNVCGVHRDYTQRIRFLRYKDLHIYQYRGKKDDYGRSNFLDKISIRVNYGKEYSRLSRTGLFETITERRTEVTVTTKVPDLGDAEESEKFIRDIWEFSRSIGDMLS